MEVKNIENLDLFFEDEIEWNGLKIQIPKINEIIKIKEDNYTKLLEPVCTPFEYLEEIIPDKSLIKQYKTFDLFCLKYYKENGTEDYVYKNKDGVPMINILCKTICYFTKNHPKYIEQYKAIIFDNNSKSFINRDNFDDFAELIIRMNGVQKFKIQKMPEFKTERAKESWIKLHSGRTKTAKENEIFLLDKIIAIMLGSKSFIPKNIIKEFNIYEFNTVFNGVLNLDTWDRDFEKYLVGTEPKDLQIKKHWLYSLKLSV
jgi:hypothetical protein